MAIAGAYYDNPNRQRRTDTSAWNNVQVNPGVGPTQPPEPATSSQPQDEPPPVNNDRWRNEAPAPPSPNPSQSYGGSSSDQWRDSWMRSGGNQQPAQQPVQSGPPALRNGMNSQEIDAYTQSQYGNYGRTATPEDLGIWRNYYNSPQYASGQGSGYWNSQMNSLLGEFQKYGNHDRSAAALAAYNSGQGQNNGGIGPSTGTPPGNTGVMGPTNTGMNIPPELMTAFQQFLASYNKPQATPPPERTKTLKEMQNQNPNRSSTQYRKGTR